LESGWQDGLDLLSGEVGVRRDEESHGISIGDCRSRATALFLMGGAAELIEAVVSGSLRLSRAQVVDQLTALWVASLSG
jgi:hypothetical protein